MPLRFGSFAALLLTSFAFIPRARATTLQNAGATVQATYYNGAFASTEGEINTISGTSAPVTLASVPVNYLEGADDLSTIIIGGTQITIHNFATQPFCSDGSSAGTACGDQIDGFDFLFTGENIISVTVDALSAAAFAPVTATASNSTTHLGLQLISPNEIRVDVTGAQPAPGADLILDVEVTPEPSSTWIFALLGLIALTRETLRRRVFSR